MTDRNRHHEDEDELEAGVPAELIDLYVELEHQAVVRGVDVQVLIEELRTLAGQS